MFAIDTEFVILIVMNETPEEKKYNVEQRKEPVEPVHLLPL